MSQSRFAQKELKKFGWKEGSGLGKNENGMKEAIKVKIKNDSHGVGHNRGDEFTFHWWDHVFNKAASSIVVESTQEGVSVNAAKESVGVSTKKARTYDNKTMLYGQFVKGATLDNNQEVKSEGEEVDASEVTEYLEEDRQTLQKLPDEEILKICGGMTAHKGARHGLKLNGKLERIQEQERLLMEKWKKQKGSNSEMDKSERSSLNAKTDTTENEDVNRECVKTKKKKKKRDKYKDAEKISQNQSPDCDDSQEIQNDKSDVKKEKKRKRKNIELGHETDIDHETKRTKKKKKRDRV
ncbi:G patch domain-containing protein 4-like [Crassostrea angulata]|uniref:G patch domain-containing protein 4-like n=1 Tax=Magallana angulata TaxID=2784310 RepID=UPI0022B20272|nr:G patch domain-containing protein 4-like [Crassostrea angulata]